MLKFLTHKLKTQSLNEDDQPFENKVKDDHDSGTESDDESGELSGYFGDNQAMDHEEDSDWEEREMYQLPLRANNEGPGAGEMMMMLGGGGRGGRDSANSDFEPGHNADSALPSDSDHTYDHHSSEEELEVINSSSYDEVDDEVNLPEGGEVLEDNALESRGGAGTENCKRKWSQVAANRLSVESTSSSDEEVQGLLRPLSTPVEFRTSPPVDAHKPSRSQSPPPKLFLFSGPSSPPIVTSTSNSDEASPLPPNPISSDVVSTSFTNCSLSLSAGGGLAERSHGVFRGIRKFSPYLSNATSGAFEMACTRSQNGELAPSPVINFSSLTNSTFSSSSSGAFGKVVRTGGVGKESTARKRQRHHNSHRHHNRERPWLDFEKMQQLTTRSVNTWRSSGELSLYCS